MTIPSWRTWYPDDTSWRLHEVHHSNWAELSEDYWTLIGIHTINNDFMRIHWITWILLMTCRGRHRVLLILEEKEKKPLTSFRPPAGSGCVSGANGDVVRGLQAGPNERVRINFVTFKGKFSCCRCRCGDWRRSAATSGRFWQTSINSVKMPFYLLLFQCFCTRTVRWLTRTRGNANIWRLTSSFKLKIHNNTTEINTGFVLN